MSITSKDYIAFLTAVTAAYFILPEKLQWLVLLAASMGFYALSGLTGVTFILVTTIVTFFAALAMERANTASKSILAELKDRDSKAAERERVRKQKKRLFVLTCLVTFGIWVVVKYSPMLLQTLHTLAPSLNLSGANVRVESFIVPLGISFYTFTSAGYVIDVSRKKYPAEHNFLKYLLFVSFFPHIIQGPFSRFDRLGKTLFEGHRFDYDRVCRGMRRMLFGYFEKLLVADKLSPTVSAVMASPEQYQGVYLFVAVIAYGIQLYADFAGYMNIMCGFCEVLGVELEENFRQPYFSVSIQNYWTRWHMTLGHWYSDYIFYPCSMGKTAQKIGRNARHKFGPRMGKLLPSYFAMIFVWTLTGLWHGARWTFVVWGWLNFAIIVFSMQMEPVYGKMKSAFHINDGAWWWKVFMIIRTLLLVSLLRIFYCSTTVAGALKYISLMFRPNWNLLAHPVQVLVTACAGESYVLFYILAGVLAMFGVDLAREKNYSRPVPGVIRGITYGLMLCLIIMGAAKGNGSAGGFMYAQF